MMRNGIGSIIVLVFMGSNAIADPLVGMWQTEPDEGAFAHVAIAPCGTNFCGTIERTYKDGVEYV